MRVSSVEILLTCFIKLVYAFPCYMCEFNFKLDGTTRLWQLKISEVISSDKILLFRDIYSLKFYCL